MKPENLDKKIFKSKNFIKSFHYAVEGLKHSLFSQNNMRIHYIFVICAIIAALFFDLSKVETSILLITISMVVATELINTAIESAVDLFTDKYHEKAKIAKDVAAGAVLVTAINAFVVGYLLFFNRLNPITLNVLTKIRRQEIHLTFLGIILILVIVIGVKTYTRTGSPLQGGSVSGHSALGFGLATTISLISQNTLIATMSFFLAFLIAQSRVEGKIHSKREAFFGAILGIVIMVVIFEVFQI